MIATVRSTAKKVLGPKLSAYLRSLKIKNLPSTGEYRQHLRGRTALEIGGPSEIFALGPLPIYSVLRGVDNCNYAAQTLWEPAGFGPTYGRTFIGEASSLKEIPDRSYGCVLSSHSLEHLANPLKALYEWKRVLSPDGLLLLILPDKERTFDWRRPVTPLDHMIGDYAQGTSEDDLTHLKEILELHDLSRDLLAGTPEQFKARSLKNSSFRALHHHVFSVPSTLEMLKHAGFSPVLSEAAPPLHMIFLARKIE
ncbi:MAG TPA: methyltransferase domain-containing protein [Terriglobales bacterium]|nr:methyltransferase domain-containing protein [Terriglobales bacterium]